MHSTHFVDRNFPVLPKGIALSKTRPRPEKSSETKPPPVPRKVASLLDLTQFETIYQFAPRDLFIKTARTKRAPHIVAGLSVYRSTTSPTSPTPSSTTTRLSVDEPGSVRRWTPGRPSMDLRESINGPARVHPGSRKSPDGPG